MGDNLKFKSFNLEDLLVEKNIINTTRNKILYSKKLIYCIENLNIKQILENYSQINKIKISNLNMEDMFSYQFEDCLLVVDFESFEFLKRNNFSTVNNEFILVADIKINKFIDSEMILNLRESSFILIPEQMNKFIRIVENWDKNFLAKIGTVVIGSAGGVGTTTLACALALERKKRRLKSVYFDSNIHGIGIDILMGISNLKGIRWDDVKISNIQTSLDKLFDVIPKIEDYAGFLSFNSMNYSEMRKMSQTEHIQIIEKYFVNNRTSIEPIVDINFKEIELFEKVLKSAKKIIILTNSDIKNILNAAIISKNIFSFGAEIIGLIKGSKLSKTNFDNLQKSSEVETWLKVKNEYEIIKLSSTVGLKKLHKGKLIDVCKILNRE